MGHHVGEAPARRFLWDQQADGKKERQNENYTPSNPDRETLEITVPQYMSPYVSL